MSTFCRDIYNGKTALKEPDKDPSTFLVKE